MNRFFNALLSISLILLDDTYGQNFEVDLFTPLTLMYDQTTFHSRIETDPNKANVWTKMTACPANEEDFKTIKQQHPDVYCLVPSVEQKSRCSSSFQPRMVLDSECGEDAKLYTFRYDVCFRNKSGQEQLVAIDVYSVCYDETQKQTLYTRHAVSSSTSIKISNPDTFAEYLLTVPLGDFKHDLGNLKEIYKLVNQEVTLPNEHLVAQMLVSPLDLDPEFARNTNYHYINTRPQWYSLHLLWEIVNETIWSYINKENPDAKIYTGTAEILEIDDKEQIYQKDGLVFKIPLIWWNLITTREGKAIIVVLYNVPFQSKSKLQHIDHVCHFSLCKNPNQDGLTAEYIQCCRPKQSTLTRLGFNEKHHKYETLKLEPSSKIEESSNTLGLIEAIRHVLGFRGHKNDKN